MAQETVCGLQNFDLINDTIKILKLRFSYNKKKHETERHSLTTVKKIQKGSQCMNY